METIVKLIIGVVLAFLWGYFTDSFALGVIFFAGFVSTEVFLNFITYINGEK